MKKLSIQWALIFFLLCLFLLVVFRNWFSHSLLSALDIPFFYPERLREFQWQPYAWNNNLGDGLGGSSIPFLNIDTFLSWGVRLLVLTLNISWNLSVRLLFFWPFMVICFISAYLFVHSIIKEKLFSLIGSLVYLTNTYVLMVVAGGQMGLALAYAICPLVLFSYFRKRFFLFVLSYTAILLFDYRLSFLIAAVLLFSIFFTGNTKAWWNNVFFLAKSFILSFGIQGYWLLPGLLSSSFSLPEGYGKTDWLPFLSVATFSNSLSLLHPNWPENIFGKTYFMRAEFLLLPIIAFLSLIFIKRNKYITLFAAIALLGAFFAKGVNPPFGKFYNWLFLHAPFFNAFRDPTKFYLLVAFSYSVLIPFTLSSIAKLIKNTKLKIYLLFVFVFYWLILLAPVWRGEVKGTFAKTKIPDEYFRLEKLVAIDQDFNRILVVPGNYRFVFSSANHPVLDASKIFKTTQIQEIVNNFNTASGRALLEKLSVKYVVVPDDFTQEIFLTERKYDQVLRTRVAELLDKSFFLHKVTGFNNLNVYTIDSYKNLFYSLDEMPAKIQFWQDSPIKFTVFIQDAKKPASIVFAEKFDNNWKLWDRENIITSQKTVDGLNSFLLNKTGTYQVSVYYTLQNLLQKGEIVSLATILLIIIFGLFKILKRKKTLDKTILIVIALLVFIGLLFIVFRLNQDAPKIKDKNIWWSKGWQNKNNPFDGKLQTSSKYGGSELRFDVKNSDQIEIILSGWGAGVSNFVDGTNRMYVIKDGQMQKVSLSINKKSEHKFRLRTFCSGPPACRIIIYGLNVSKEAKFFSPKNVPINTLAILGDSINNSHGPDGYTYFLTDHLNFILHNAAIFGSTLCGEKESYPAVDRVEEDIVNFQPEIVLISIGTNDISRGISLDKFKSCYERILSHFKDKLPNSQIKILALLPRYDSHQKEVLLFNREIKILADEYNFKFIDISDHLERSDYSDEIHPSFKAQPKVANLLQASFSDH